MRLLAVVMRVFDIKALREFASSCVAIYNKAIESDKSDGKTEVQIALPTCDERDSQMIRSLVATAKNAKSYTLT